MTIWVVKKGTPRKYPRVQGPYEWPTSLIVNTWLWLIHYLYTVRKLTIYTCCAVFIFSQSPHQNWLVTTRHNRTVTTTYIYMSRINLPDLANFYTARLWQIPRDLVKFLNSCTYQRDLWSTPVGITSCELSSTVIGPRSNMIRNHDPTGRPWSRPCRQCWFPPRTNVISSKF